MQSENLLLKEQKLVLEQNFQFSLNFANFLDQVTTIKMGLPNRKLKLKRYLTYQDDIKVMLTNLEKLNTETSKQVRRTDVLIKQGAGRNDSGAGSSGIDLHSIQS